MGKASPGGALCGTQVREARPAHRLGPAAFWGEGGPCGLVPRCRCRSSARRCLILMVISELRRHTNTQLGRAPGQGNSQRSCGEGQGWAPGSQTRSPVPGHRDEVFAVITELHAGDDLCTGKENSLVSHPEPPAKVPCWSGLEGRADATLASGG